MTKRCLDCGHAIIEPVNKQGSEVVLTCGRSSLSNSTTKYEKCTSMRYDSGLTDSCGSQAKYFKEKNNYNSFRVLQPK